MLKNNALYRLAFPTTAQLPPKTNGYFGKAVLDSKDSSPPADDPSIRPFTVEADQAVLDDLQRRLAEAKIADSIEGTNFRYGFNSKVLTDIVHYWRHSFNWKQQQQVLNTFPQYQTEIEGLNVHFVHVRPEKPSGVVLPLLVIHGWPGSVYEYYKAFPMLTDCNTGGLAFEVIAPSIPGYGFSEAPHKEGFNVIAAARVFVKLMLRLGFTRFFVHGGDWGSAISRTIAQLYPENVRGVHTTLHMANNEPQGLDILRFMAAKYLPMVMFRNRDSERVMFNELEASRSNWYLESGYMHIQSTKPDTVGAALTDSPVGLLAYILEKFSSWTNFNNVYKADGGLGSWPLDDLITNVMIYWLSNNVTSSLRFYRENLCPGSGALSKYSLSAAKVSASVPAAYAVVPNEIFRAPRFVVEMTYDNLVQYSELPRGGHFAAFEEPELIVEDLKKFARIVVARPK
ncbi:epoxide hydrolase [Tyrophagus putrescentiae]|nr:epoxide hydrolase [Tyrophagus putrescentiae]